VASDRRPSRSQFDAIKLASGASSFDDSPSDGLPKSTTSRKCVENSEESSRYGVFGRNVHVEMLGEEAASRPRFDRKDVRESLGGRRQR